MPKRGAGPARLDARRKEVQLNSNLSKKLTAYVASALCRPSNILTAAAVGVVGLAGQPAAADIILNTNPITIPYPTICCTTFGGSLGDVPWSFDGGAKFNFSNASVLGKYISDERVYLKLRGLSGNGFEPGPLANGMLIGRGGAFRESSVLASVFHTSNRGTFTAGHWYEKSGYLGFEFTTAQDCTMAGDI